MGEELVYSINKLSKVYRNLDSVTYALNKIDLTLNSGEVIIILGPSGSGKSTLLNMLSGIDSPTEGNIFFMDKEISKYGDKDLTKYRKENLGFVFQSYNLIANLTIRENIELGEHLSESALDIDEIIELVGLKDHKYKFPYQLSGGQMQRVAIARALVKNPRVLFCDEPTGALDEKMGKQILKLIQDINERYKTTVIIVTHNPSIAQIGNTVLKMNSGKIVEKISNDSVISAEEIRWA